MEVEFYVWPPEHFFLFQIGSACIVNKEKKTTLQQGGEANDPLPPKGNSYWKRGKEKIADRSPQSPLVHISELTHPRITLPLPSRNKCSMNEEELMAWRIDAEIAGEPRSDMSHPSQLDSRTETAWGLALVRWGTKWCVKTMQQQILGGHRSSSANETQINSRRMQQSKEHQ